MTYRGGVAPEFVRSYLLNGYAVIRHRGTPTGHVYAMNLRVPDDAPLDARTETYGVDTRYGRLQVPAEAVYTVQAGTYAGAYLTHRRCRILIAGDADHYSDPTTELIRRQAIRGSVGLVRAGLADVMPLTPDEYRVRQAADLYRPTCPVRLSRFTLDHADRIEQVTDRRQPRLYSYVRTYAAD